MINKKREGEKGLDHIDLIDHKFHIDHIGHVGHVDHIDYIREYNSIDQNQKDMQTDREKDRVSKVE